jgi:hypothetical protein
MMRASPQGATMPLGPLPPSPVPNRRAQERERDAVEAAAKAKRKEGNHCSSRWVNEVYAIGAKEASSRVSQCASCTSLVLWPRPSSY